MSWGQSVEAELWHNHVEKEKPGEKTHRVLYYKPRFRRRSLRRLIFKRRSRFCLVVNFTAIIGNPQINETRIFWSGSVADVLAGEKGLCFWINRLCI